MCRDLEGLRRGMLMYEVATDLFGQRYYLEHEAAASERSNSRA